MIISFSAVAELIEKQGTPMVLVSGHADADHVVLEDEPVITRLTKPITLQALKETIELALRGSKESRPQSIP